MVGVSECAGNNYEILSAMKKINCWSMEKFIAHTVPGLVPCQVLNINQYSLEFHNGKCRMCVVQLNSDLVRELIPWPVGLLESSDDVV